jgi:hypothetical protein
MTTRLGGAGFTHWNATTNATIASTAAGPMTESCSRHAQRHFMEIS